MIIRPIINRALKAFHAHSLQRQRIYIVPTRAGLLFIGVNFTLFLMGLVYANNLVLLLAFAIFASLLLIMFQTHSILEGCLDTSIKIHSASAQEIQLNIVNSSKNGSENGPKQLIAFELKTNTQRLYANPRQGRYPLSASTPKNKQKNKPVPRGKYALTHFKTWTTGEQGLFYVWRWSSLQETFYVYPSPIPAPESLRGHSKESERGSQEFEEHKRFANSENPNRIDWKVYARSGELMSKVFNQDLTRAWLLDQSSIEGEKEVQIQKMAWLVNHCFHNALSWSIKGPGYHLAPGSGANHWRTSMELISEA